MPVNFNALRQTGPSGFAEGLAQGQEEQRVNALAQQKMGQEQEMNTLRVQQLRGTIGEQEATRKKQSLLDKTGMFRERLLRAPTPEAAREIVKMQYADPDIGPVISQGGSLEQSLAEVSDDPKLFDRYKQQEAMGMSEWMKSQMPKTVGNAIYLPGENRFMQPPAAPEKPPAPPASIAEYGLAQTDPKFMNFLQARAAATRAPVAAAQPSAPKEDKAPSGYRFTKTGELEAIPGGPAAKVKEPTVSEQNASYNINRVLNAATEIKNITAKDPDALAPSFSEASARSMGAEGAANVARSPNRQIVYGAQRDALDALLYLATGAAYNKEQLQGAWDSYMPAYTDDKATKTAKQARLGTLLDDAKARAGKAWTPKMESAMQSLISPSASSAVSGKVTPAAPAAGALSAAEEAELAQLRKRFGK